MKNKKKLCGMKRGFVGDKILLLVLTRTEDIIALMKCHAELVSASYYQRKSKE